MWAAGAGSWDVWRLCQTVVDRGVAFLAQGRAGQPRGLQFGLREVLLSAPLL